MAEFILPSVAQIDTYGVIQECRAHLLDWLGHHIMDAGISDQEAIGVFTRAVGEYFDERVASGHRAGFEQANGLTASRISLVQEDQLELEIRLNEISARLNETTGASLWRLHLRFVTLLQRADMPRSDNPVGPAAFARGFNELCAHLSQSMERNLSLLARLETHFSANLSGLYAEINDILVRNQVQPAASQSQGGAQSAGAAAGRGGARGGGGGGTEAGGEDPFALLQKTLMARQGQSSPGDIAAYAALSQGNSTGMPGMIAPSGGFPAMAGGAAAPSPAVTLAMLENLFQRLGELEQINRPARPPRPAAAASAGKLDFDLDRDLSGAPGQDSPAPALADGDALQGEVEEAAEPAESTEGALPRPLASRDINMPLRQTEAAIIDAVGLVFQAIFDNPHLPDLVKSALGSLQIPLLKIALVDPSLFGEATHPARILLDLMARSALGLPRDVAKSHPVCAELFRIAGVVRQDYQGDAAVLEHPIADLESLIAQRNQALDGEAQRYGRLIAKAGQEALRRQQAEGKARQVVRQVLERNPPAPIALFMEGYWSRVLAHTLYQNPSEERWQAVLDVVKELYWSIQPKATPDERKRLTTLLPSLVNRINQGLDQIQVPQEERGAFLDACFGLQMQALKGKVPVAEGKLPPSPRRAPALPVVVTLTEGDHRLEVVEIPGVVRDLTRPRIHPWKQGDWLDFQLPSANPEAPDTGGAVPLCGRIAWIRPEDGSPLLTNPEWSFAVLMEPDVLAQQLRDGRGAVVAASGLFEGAVQKALRRSEQA